MNFPSARAAADWVAFVGYSAFVVWTSVQPPSRIPSFVVRYDKAFHFFQFALVFLLAVSAFTSSRLRELGRPVLLAWGYAVLLGASTELLQFSAPGRHPGFADWVSDCAGAAAAFAALWTGRRRLPPEMF